MDTNLILYYYPGSPPSRSVLLMTRYANINLRLKVIDITKGEQMKENYIKMNPCHTVPTLDDNGFYVCDSNSIMRYLIEQYERKSPLVPRTSSKIVAKMDQRLFYNAIVLLPNLIKYMSPVLLKKEKPSKDTLVTLEDSFAMFNILQAGRTYIIGDKLTIADFAYFTTVSTAEAVAVDVAKYASVSRWYNRMKHELELHGLDELNTKTCETIKLAWSDITLSHKI